MRPSAMCWSAAGGLLWVAGACNGDSTAPVTPAEPDTVVSSIEVNPSERTIGVLGTQFDVGAVALNGDGTILYVSGTGRLSWSSSAPDVATLDTRPHFTGREIPVVTGVGEGTATITASSQGVSDSMIVTVHDRARFGWSVPISGGINAGNVIGADGTIYVATSDAAAGRTLWYAVSPQGSILWTVDVPLTGRTIPAIGDDGTLYLGSRTGSGATGFTGRLIAVDPGGSVRWTLEDLDGIRSSPALGADGTIYVAGGHHVYAVDPQGEVQWTYERDDKVFVFSSPAVASDGTIYVGGYDNLLHAINPDGSPRWTFKTRDVIQSSPSIGTDGTIYFGSMDGSLYAVNPDGTERWSVEVDFRGVVSSPSIGPDGTIYVGGAGVFAVDPGGSIRWNFPGSQLLSTPILGADGTVYIVAGGGITAFDADGEPLWDYLPEHGAGGSALIGLDGTIFVAAHDLVAMVETASANGDFAGSPWPTMRGNPANNGRTGG